MSDQRVEVWTLGASRPRGLPDHCVHVPCLTRGGAGTVGTRLRSGADLGSPCEGPGGWGWWRDDGAGVQKALGQISPTHYADIEPASWPTSRTLRDPELELARRCRGVTGMGYPSREAGAISGFAQFGAVGIPQLYRDGNDPTKAARGVRRRCNRWRELGFESLMGLLGGSRSGRVWVLGALEECERQGVGVAFWGWGPIQREAAELAYVAGLGRGGPYV